MKTGLLRSRKLAGGFGLLLALALLLIPCLKVLADAPPTPPHYFFGSVSICGTPAPEGTLVEAKINSVVVASSPANAGGNYGLMEVYGQDGNTVELWAMAQMLHSEPWVSLQASDVDLLVRPTLTTASSAGGSVTTPGEPGPFGPYDCGSVVDIVATEDVGYDFANWTGDVGTVADVNDPSTTITMNGFYSIMANFVPEGGVDFCELTTASTAGGSVTGPGETGPFPYVCGSVVDIVATADECYEFVNWTGNVGTVADVNDPTTTITMDANYSIMANFQLKQMELTTASSAGGSVTDPGEPGPFQYGCGSVVDIVATADECYEFVNWTGNVGTVADVNDPTTTITMDADYSIMANFQLKQFNLTIASTGSGSVTEPGEGVVGPYDCGSVVDLFADPDPGWYFSQWTGDIGTIGDVGAADTSITMMDDYSITAVFLEEGIQYCDLTTASTAGGSVTDPGEPGPFQYVCDSVVDIVATADECYEFVNWTGNVGTVADVNDPTTTITVDANYSITANFQLKQVELTTASTAGGSVTNPGEPGPFQYACGTVVNIEAVASGCYNFSEWTGDVGTVADVNDPTTTITMDDNYSITAVFVLAEALGDIEIPFNMGWNTFSTPISLHECVDTWDEFIAANNLNVEMIYGYNNDENAWVNVAGGEEINPLWGFYVKVAEAGVAHIIPNSEVTPPPVRNLAAGVHLIGIAPASLGDELLTTVLFTAYWAQNGFIGYELVVSPNINPDSWAYTRDVGDSPMMSSGRAYWLVMGNATEYEGSSTTPVP